MLNALPMVRLLGVKRTSSEVWLSNPNQGLDDRLHYGRVDSVTDHPDFVTPSAMLEVMAIREAHRTTQFALGAFAAWVHYLPK